MKKLAGLLVPLTAILSFALPAYAAQGEMGTGIAMFGQYATSLGGHITVYSLSEATVNFPTGCTALLVSPSILGTEPYKIIAATLLTANAAGKRVRFFSHAENGCAIDYAQLVD